MKARKGKLVIPIMGTNKREAVTVIFSKNGVDQNWNLFFNSGRLLTDKVYISYNPPVFLRTVEKCKTLNDVIDFLNEYVLSQRFVTIGMVSNSDGNFFKRIEILKLMDLKLNPFKLKGTLHWGRHTIEFKDGYVSFTLSNTYNDGTYKITGLKDILRITNKIVGNLHSNYEFALALKKIETL
jgi:hypothetical protein